MKYLFIILCLSTAMIACNKATDSKYTNGANGNNPNQKASELMYPHDKDWVNTHGAKFLQDRSQCFACHGADGSGGNSQVSCTKCHNTFPHAPNFALPQNHGAAFDGNRNACLHCHNNPDKKVNPVSCNACHKAYPHEDGFAEGGHAEIAGTYEGKCLNCHKDMKKHMPTYGEGDGCKTCHEGSPKMKWIKDGKPTTAKVKIKTSKTDERLPSSKK